MALLFCHSHFCPTCSEQWDCVRMECSEDTDSLCVACVQQKQTSPPLSTRMRAKELETVSLFDTRHLTQCKRGRLLSKKTLRRSAFSFASFLIRKVCR